MYLDLLKKMLVDYHRIGYTEYKPIYLVKDSWKIKLVINLDKILRKWNLAICKPIDFTVEDRTEGKDWPSYADTMIGLKRLDNIEFCVANILNDNIPGDFIETGVWRGGATIFMKALLKENKSNDRIVWVADSFAGLPKPDSNKYTADSEDRHYLYSELSISKEIVENNFRKYNLLDDNVKFLKGWFKDTLPTAPIKQLALLRLDGDLYESTMDAIINLYPKLSVGGYIIIDDWGAVKGCKQAVQDYRLKHIITEKIETIDWTGVYWRKEK